MITKVIKIKFLSLIKLHTVFFAIAGLIAGILYSFGGLILDILVSIDWITSSETPGLSFGTVLAFGALIGMPIIFATAGFCIGLIEAILYKLFAKWLGELNIDL